MLAAGILLMAGEAAAQDLSELRGTTTEGRMLDELLPGSALDIAAADTENSEQMLPEAAVAPIRPETAPVADDLSTGTVRAGRMEPGNRRASAIGGLARSPEEDPYGPLGIRMGSFLLTPRLDQGIGWTSNASSAPGGDGAIFSETRLRLDAISDWSRHSAAIEADGLYRRSLSGADLEELEGSIAGELRLDLSGGFSATATGGYAIEPESASSPVDIVGAVSQPVRQTLSAGLGLAKDMGKLRLGIAGDVERDVYGDAEIEGGGALSQEDRDSTLATVTLRGGYEISPALLPFVEAEIGRRTYDLEMDSAGYRRSADRYGARAGLEFDLGEKFRGEISAGWLTEQPDDPRLEAISGASVEGNVEWSPVRGTVVGLNAATEVESATMAGQSGSILYSGSLAVTRQMRSNLTGEASVGIDWRDYASTEGHDLVLRGEVSLTWWLNRNLGLTGRASHETQESSLPDRDYSANSVYLGLTLQR
jgi:hypothetical protein